MLNENDVVASVERFLRDAGWAIVRRAGTTQTGPDLEAVHGTTACRLYVEAKGATSARRGSQRYGRPFDRNQVKDHVANAFYTAARVSHHHLSSIAIPRTPLHEDFVDDIRDALARLKIAILWVGEDRVVTTWNWRDDRGVSEDARTTIDRPEEPDRRSDSATPSTADNEPRSMTVNQKRRTTEEELQDRLRAFRRHLEDQGYKPGPLGFRMNGASRFALFLAGRPLRKGEGPPDGWQG